MKLSPKQSTEAYKIYIKLQIKLKAELVRVRLPDEDMDGYFAYAKTFFNLLRKHIPESDEFFKSTDTTNVVAKYRGSYGGNSMFRPIGLDVFIRIIAKLNNNHTLTVAVKIAAKLPRKLIEPPFAELMWNTSTNTIINAHRVTLCDILPYMLGDSKYSDDTLLERYRKDTGDDSATLPEIVV